MPVLSVVAHLALVHSDGLSAVVAVLGEHRVEAGQAEGLSVAHYVPLTAQLFVAFEAGEVLHVPCSSFRLGALICEDYLEWREGIER